MKPPGHPLKIALAGLLPLAIAACTVGPPYRPPSPAPTSAWKEQGTGGSADIDDGWWRLFDDAQLDQFVADGLENNRDVAAALGRFDEARALLGVARADRYPAVTLDPLLARARTSATIANRLPVLDTNVYRVPIDVAYEVDLWGRVRRSVAAAKAQLEASAFSVAALRLSVAAEITTAYLQAASYAREADAVRRTTALRNESLELAQRRFDAGAVSELDVLRARSELEQSGAELEDIVRRRALTVHALAVLVARPAQDVNVDEIATTFGVPLVPAGLPAQVLERRPDIAQAERVMAAASEQIGIAEASRFPVVRLTGSGGVAALELSSLARRDSLAWSFGPSITFPLFEGGRIESNIEASRARYEQAQAAFERTVLTAFREVEDALSDGAALARRAVHLRAATRASVSAAQLARDRYERGAGAYLDVLDAERTTIANERSEIQNDQQRLASSVSLLKALGGGWHRPSDAVGRGKSAGE